MVIHDITVSYMIGHNFSCIYQIGVLKSVPESSAHARSIGVGKINGRSLQLKGQSQNPKTTILVTRVSADTNVANSTMKGTQWCYGVLP